MQNITKNLKNLEPIGFARGGFAVVHKAILYSNNSQTGRIVAVKLLDVSEIAVGGGGLTPEKRSQMARRCDREIRAGQAVRHPNILPILGFYDNPNPAYKEFVGVVLPFCENGDSITYIRRNPDVNRFHVLVGTSAAIFALHSTFPPVVHGDITPQNILVYDDGSACLSDFGLSRVCETRGFTTTTFMGTLRYLAPELFRGDEDLPTRRTTASDIWAFAMTILEIMTGEPPLASMKTPGGIFNAVVIEGARPVKPLDSSINDALWSLLERCWSGDPAARPDARHACLVLDIIYGGNDHNLQPSVVAAILDSTGDDVALPSRHDHSDPASLPYKCKWLNCSRAFRCIDECIAHECEEFSKRRNDPVKWSWST